MASVTTVTCDRCNAVIAEKEQVWRIVLIFACAPSWPSTSGSTSRSADWCRDCMLLMHLLGDGTPQEDVVPVQPAPTMEDYVREIVREEMGP